MDRSALEECVSFFRKNRGYARLFEEMRKKYNIEKVWADCECLDLEDEDER